MLSHTSPFSSGQQLHVASGSPIGQGGTEHFHQWGKFCWTAPAYRRQSEFLRRTFNPCAVWTYLSLQSYFCLFIFAVTMPGAFQTHNKWQVKWRPCLNTISSKRCSLVILLKGILPPPNAYSPYSLKHSGDIFSLLPAITSSSFLYCLAFHKVLTCGFLAHVIKYWSTFRWIALFPLYPKRSFQLGHGISRGCVLIAFLFLVLGSYDTVSKPLELYLDALSLLNNPASSITQWGIYIFFLGGGYILRDISLPYWVVQS